MGEAFKPLKIPRGRGFKSHPARTIKNKMKENFNIFDHILVPKHVLLNQEEVTNLLKKYNINLNQLPKISIKDPAAKILNAKKEDVIKIIRKSETAGLSEFYRVVVGEE